MLRAENQANKAEKLLKGAPVEPKRNWFQTHKERMEEKGTVFCLLVLYDIL